MHRMSAVESWLVGGGAVALAGALIYLGRILGRLDATLKGVVGRVDRLERQSDTDREWRGNRGLAQPPRVSPDPKDDPPMGPPPMVG
jgi:hypothetical protein